MHSPAWRGVALVLIAASLWGTTGTVQALAGGTLAPAWVGTLRLVVAALFFNLWVAALAIGAASASRSASHVGVNAGRSAAAPSAAVVRRLLLGAGVCMAVYNLAFFAGVRAAGIALGTALALGSGPLWSGLLQALVQRQAPSRLWWAGAAASVAGAGLMSGAARGGLATTLSAGGVALCLAAGAAYASYTFCIKRLAPALPALRVTRAAFTVAALLALPFAWLDVGLPQPSTRDLLAMGYLGIVTTGVAYVLYGIALRLISAATAVTLALFEPVVAFGLAVLVVGESTTADAVIGLGLVLSGVLLVVRAELTPNAVAESSKSPAKQP